jgi:hypothetical protein
MYAYCWDWCNVSLSAVGLVWRLAEFSILHFIMKVFICFYWQFFSYPAVVTIIGHRQGCSFRPTCMLSTCGFTVLVVNILKFYIPTPIITQNFWFTWLNSKDKSACPIAWFELATYRSDSDLYTGTLIALSFNGFGSISWHCILVFSALLQISQFFFGFPTFSAWVPLKRS